MVPTSLDHRLLDADDFPSSPEVTFYLNNHHWLLFRVDITAAMTLKAAFMALAWAVQTLLSVEQHRWLLVLGPGGGRQEGGPSAEADMTQSASLGSGGAQTLLRTRG